jgi:small subunit ribosomal protein S11
MPPNSHLSRLFRPSICSSCRQAMRKGQQAPLSTTARLSADEKSTTTTPATPQPGAQKLDKSFYDDMRGYVDGLNFPSRNTTRRQSTQGLVSEISNAMNIPQQTPGSLLSIPTSVRPRDEPHHLHIYAHKHNTHIVLTRPNREPILSYSTGNIGFRKAQRGSFDAAFQLAAYVMRTITDKGLLRSERILWGESNDTTATTKGRRKIEAPIQKLEVVLRGFGKGREAVVKAMLGTEGRWLREKVVVVSDDTKLKFGGTRSPNPRRLG